MRERDVERSLVRRVKEIGGEVRKVVWAGRRGAPDRVVMLPGREILVCECGCGCSERVPPCVIWVELKRPGKLATFPSNAHERAQAREHERMRAMGQRVVVVDSIEGVEEVLR